MYSLEYTLVLSIAVIVLGYVVTPLLAARKGYAWYLWTLGGGLILPLLILAFLPFANQPQDPPEVRAERRSTGNTIGIIFTVLGVIAITIRLLTILVPRR
jgi:hypothetical protein